MASKVGKKIHEGAQRKLDRFHEQVGILQDANTGNLPHGKQPKASNKPKANRRVSNRDVADLGGSASAVGGNGFTFKNKQHAVPQSNKSGKMLYHGAARDYKTIKSGGKNKVLKKMHEGNVFATSSERFAEETAVGHHFPGTRGKGRRKGFVHIVDPKDFKYSAADAVRGRAQEEAYKRKGDTTPRGGYWVKQTNWYDPRAKINPDRAKIKRTSAPIVKPGQKKNVAYGAAAAGAAGYGYYKARGGKLVDKQKTVAGRKVNYKGVKFTKAPVHTQVRSKVLSVGKASHVNQPFNGFQKRKQGDRSPFYYRNVGGKRHRVRKGKR